jgi:hypothetical protein
MLLQAVSHQQFVKQSQFLQPIAFLIVNAARPVFHDAIQSPSSQLSSLYFKMSLMEIECFIFLFCKLGVIKHVGCNFCYIKA